MFGFIFEIIIFIVIFRAILDSKKNRQRKQQTSQGATPPPLGNRPATPSYKPPVPNKPAAKKQKTGWTPRSEKTKTAVPNRPNPEKEASDAKTSARTFIEPTKRYRAPHNAGERYEEWMPVPEGKKVCRCGYCAADNLIPKGADPGNYTCYFCREEL